MKKFLTVLFSIILFFSCGGEKAVELPVITLIGPMEVFFELNAAYVEFGYKATDAEGRDISSSVIRDMSSLDMSRAGTYQVSYTAVDRLGNKSTPVYRTVQVGSGLTPVITISGENPILLALNEEFTAPAATAVSSDGETDLSDSVTMDDGSVDTSQPGTYSVWYSVTDTGGITATAELTVYVLESNVPRIAISGSGTSAEDPLMIEQVTVAPDASEQEKQKEAAEAFEKALPTIKAYDLEDGDISYRVSVLNDAAYEAVLAAILGSGTPSVPVTMTVSDNDGNVSSVSLYVSVIPDATPPVISIADEQAVYEIEIDMWSNQWEKDWTSGVLAKLTVSVTDDNGNTTETFGTSGTKETPVATDSGIECWIEYPNVTNSSTQQEYPGSDLQTTLKHSSGENTNAYYYQTPNHEINTKTVLLKASDSAGNTGEKSLKVFLKDTTAPQILTKETSVNFGATQYSWEVRDNSGYQKTLFADIPQYESYGSMGLIEGTFTNKVTFSDTDYSKNSYSTNGTLTVKAPSTENLFPGGHFTGSVQSGANESDMEGFSPEGWSLTSYSGGSFSDLGASYYQGKVIQLNRIIETHSGFLMCGGARKGNRSAYLTSGFRATGGALSTPVSNVNLGILSGIQVKTLYQNVTYELSYEYRDFRVSSGSHSPGNRILTISRQSGTGTFNDSQSEFKLDRAPSAPADTEYPYHAITSGFQPLSQSFTVKNGNINSFTILYSVGKPTGSVDHYADVGSFISDIQVKAVNWNKLQPDGSVAPANGS